MTTDQMDARRELDALVAEKVMGLRCERLMTNPPKPSGLMRSPGGELVGLPYFSTDISVAWKVVEEMRGRGYWVSVQMQPKSGDVDCVMWLPSADDTQDFSDDEAPTAPLAICRAALKAVGA